MRILKRIVFMVVLVALTATSFMITSRWLDGPVQRSVATKAKSSAGGPPVSSGSGRTSCEIEFPTAACPAQPQFLVAADRIHRDAWEGSDTSQDRCLRRAADFQTYCNPNGKLTARFLRDGRVVASRSVP